MRRAWFVVTLLGAVAVVGCSTSATYVRPDTITKTSAFSDTDLRMNAEAIADSLAAAGFLQNRQSKPLLALGQIQNRTMQHIDTRVLEKSIQTALLKSGSVGFVDRELLQDAAQEAALVNLQRIDVADAVKLGNVVGADYFLIGYLSGIDSQHGRRSVHYTKLTMELIDVQTTEVAWLGEKEIKKASRKGLFK